MPLFTFGKQNKGAKQGSGYIGFFGLQDWFAQFSPTQQKLLRSVSPELTSSSMISTSESCGSFLSRLATGVSEQDPQLGEQIRSTACETESDPVDKHFILMHFADFYKNTVKDKDKWYSTVQQDIELLPAFCTQWKKTEKIPLPAYPAMDSMVQLLRRRGDLPEALSLVELADKMGIAGNWQELKQDLVSRMSD